MQMVALVFALGTLVMGLVLAARLLRLAMRSRKAPELAMGVYCLLVSIGSALYGAAFSKGPTHVSEASAWLSAASTLLIALAAFALGVGIWKIFHAGKRWGLFALVGVGIWIFAGWLACVLPGRPVLLGDFTATNAFFLAGRVAIYGFGAFEALRYARMLRRRAALGLGDPVAAHQIGLWGGAWVCVAMVGISSFVIDGIGGPEAFEIPYVSLIVSGLNAAAWVCTWLSFFPPVSYQRWIAGSAREAEA